MANVMSGDQHARSLAPKPELLGLEVCPTLSHFTARCCARLRAGARVGEGEGAHTDSCFTFAPQDLKARGTCLPSSEGSDKCNHAVE